MLDRDRRGTTDDGFDQSTPRELFARHLHH